MNPAVLCDTFSLIDKVLLQQGSMTIHNQSSRHNYATHSQKSKIKKETDVRTGWGEKRKAEEERRQQRILEITT